MSVLIFMEPSLDRLINRLSGKASGALQSLPGLWRIRSTCRAWGGAPPEGTGSFDLLPDKMKNFFMAQ